MVDLGQKKVDSHPPFFMSCREIKKACQVSPTSLKYLNEIFYLDCAYLAATSFQFTTFQNASIYSGRLF